jgi:hypothetical protein
MREAKKALVKLAGEVPHKGLQPEAIASQLVGAHIDHLAAAVAASLIESPSR